VVHELERFLLLITEIHELVDVKLAEWLINPIFSDIAQYLMIPSKPVLFPDLILRNERLLQFFEKSRVSVFKHDRVIVDDLKVANEFSDIHSCNLFVKFGDYVKLAILVFVDDRLFTRFSDTWDLEFFP